MTKQNQLLHILSFIHNEVSFSQIGLNTRVAALLVAWLCILNSLSVNLLNFVKCDI